MHMLNSLWNGNWKNNIPKQVKSLLSQHVLPVSRCLILGSELSGSGFRAGWEEIGVGLAHLIEPAGNRRHRAALDTVCPEENHNLTQPNLTEPSQLTMYSLHLHLHPQTYIFSPAVRSPCCSFKGSWARDGQKKYFGQRKEEIF